MKNLFFIIIPLFVLSGCELFQGNKNSKIQVAKVGDKVLYEEDFTDIFSAAQTPEDSLKLRQNYIEKWVRDEVLFQNALNNLSDSLKDKKEELDLYYRSLIRYEYENGLINQKLDTTVTSNEITDYYNQFNESFILKRRICKSTYLVFTPDIPNQEQAIFWLKDLSPENTDSLQKYCLRYGVKFNLDNNKWFFLDDLMGEALLPTSFEITKSEQPLIYNDSLRGAALFIYDLREPGEFKPLQMSRGTIRSIIKNKKKVDFLMKMEGDVFNEAERKGQFEVYE
ncbi:MAG: hypothetical protein JXQ87_03275 [Bacteroidia bacterium]